MAWQGIPFLLRGDEVFYHADFVLRQLPEVVLKTDSNGIIIASLVSALLAGAIPACVAWRAISKNGDALEKQLTLQEKLTKLTLKTEFESASQKELISNIINTTAEYVAYAHDVIHITDDLIQFSKGEVKPPDFYSLLKDQKDRLRELGLRQWKLKLLLRDHNEYIDEITEALAL